MNVISLFSWRCSCPSLWSYRGLAAALPFSRLMGASGSWREKGSGSCRASFLSKSLALPLRRAFLLAEKAGPSAICIAESPSCTPQCFLMGTCLSLRSQDGTLRFLLDFMLSLNFRISPDLKICFLFAFASHKIYIYFHYYVCSSKNGMFKKFIPFHFLAFLVLICNHFHKHSNRDFHSL